VEPLALDDILDLESYERVRPRYRARVIAHKKMRRISLGRQVTLVFEDRETLRYQIQEMTRVEHTTRRDKVQLEIDVYNELIPAENELSATLFIEIPELDQIRPALDRLIGIDEHVALLVGGGGAGETIRARFDDRQMEAERISAVHYLRFSLSPAQAEAFRTGPPPRLRVDHAAYRHEALIEGPARESLAADLSNQPPVLMDATGSSHLYTDFRPDPRPDLPPDPSPDSVLVSTDRVRAWRLSPDGAPVRIVVEPLQPGICFEEAEPELLAELVSLAQRLAREIASSSAAMEAAQIRIRLDLRTSDPEGLRVEIDASG